MGSVQRAQFPQLLEQAMASYPTQWDEVTMRDLIREVAELEGENVPPALTARVQRIRLQLLAPLADTVIGQREVIAEQHARAVEREAYVISALMAMQEERDLAIQRVEEEQEKAARQTVVTANLVADMEAMAEAADALNEQNKAAEEQAAEFQELARQLLAEREEIIRKAVVEGPAALLLWVRSQLKAHDIPVPLGWEESWWRWAAEMARLVSQPGRGSAAEGGGGNSNGHGSGAGGGGGGNISSEQGSTSADEYVLTRRSLKRKRGYFAPIVAAILQEGLAKFSTVVERGPLAIPLSVPAAVIGFYAALASRLLHAISAVTLEQVKCSTVGFSFQYLEAEVRDDKRVVKVRHECRSFGKVVARLPAKRRGWVAAGVAAAAASARQAKVAGS
eukprot:SM000046S16397  [mRNA]  locus=s46:474780:477598:+ [translate_table: standard]